MRIDGTTRITGVVGWPVAKSLTPAMHNAAYEALGLNWVCVPLALADEPTLMAFAEAARRIPLAGFNVTMPHKQAVMALCDEVAVLARVSGAVNTVHCVDGGLVGYNTDGRGMLEWLAAEGAFDPAGRSVAVIGAGGSAAAAVSAFVVAGARSVAVVNRSLARADALVKQLASHACDTALSAHELDVHAEDVVSAADLVLNTTPLGMNPDDPSPIPRHWLQRDQLVADIVYQSGITALMRDAAAAGAPAIGGLGMLVAQGALAIDIWASDEGVDRAPRDVMRQAAEAAMRERGRAVPGGTGV